MIKRISLLTLILNFSLMGVAQTNQELPLGPGQSVEREIAGGASQTYPIKLSAGQFMHVVAVQKGINVVVAIADPDGKEIWESSFSGNFGGQESLSYEAAAAGEYRSILRPIAVCQLPIGFNPLVVM